MKMREMGVGEDAGRVVGRGEGRGSSHRTIKCIYPKI